MTTCSGRRTDERWELRSVLRPLLGILGALFLALGCQNMSGDRTASSPAEYDPLVGGPPLPSTPSTPPGQGATAASAAAAAAAAPAAASNPVNVPPLPAPTGVTSPAALTSGTNPTLSPNRDARITPPAVPASVATPAAATTPLQAPTSALPGREWNSQAPPTGAVLRTPQPLPDPLPVPPTTLAPTSSVALASGTRPLNGDSYQQLQDALAARGVTWQILETVDNGEWKFNCSVPSRSNPNLGRRYEARGRSGAEAIRNALDKIDRDQQP